MNKETSNLTYPRLPDPAPARRGRQKPAIRFFITLFLCLFIAASSFAADLTLEDLLSNIQSNQSQIKDMYAETTTTITSNLSMTGAKGKGPQAMVQKGRMWTKGKDKSKIEMISPTRQITITNGDQMAIVNPETGQKMVQDLKTAGLQDRKTSGAMDLEKAMEYFDLSVKQTSDGEYVITGIPKERNKLLGKMEFYVDASRWVPVKILMYGPKDKLMSQSEIEHQEISGIWVPVKNISTVNSPAGKMKVEMAYENVKVNEGIKDQEFKI